MEKINKKTITVEIEIPTLQWIDKYKDRTGVSKTFLINKILREAMKNANRN